MSRQTAIQTTTTNQIQNGLAAPARPSPNSWSYLPQIDVIEWVQEYTVVCDAPGLTPSAFDLTFESGFLRMHGPVSQRYPENARFLRQEYGVGDFYREIPLGRLAEVVDGDHITAEYDRGVLTIHLPKLVSAQAKKIQVKSA